MSQNLAARSPEERAKVNVDLAASGVAYKERLNLPAFPAQVEREQPEALRECFRERLQHYRNLALQLPRGTDPVYQKEPKGEWRPWQVREEAPESGHFLLLRR